MNEYSKMKKVLESYKKLGSIDEIKSLVKSYSKKAQTVKSYESLGTPAEVNRLVESFKKVSSKLNAYESIGTPEEVNKLLKAYEDNAKSLIKRSRTLKSYSNIGSVNEVKNVVNKFLKLKEESIVRNLSKEFNIDKATARSTLNATESLAAAREILKNLTNSYESLNKQYNQVKSKTARKVVEKAVIQKAKMSSKNESAKKTSDNDRMKRLGDILNRF